jgi:flagellar hook-associated protein 2
MSDVNIPGVTNSKINTQKMIDAIMDAERKPLKRMESELDTFKKTKKIWQDLNLSLNKVKDSANALYSFDSPFSAKKASSSDETVLTAVATRKAVVADKELRVKQIASADRFMSGSVKPDYRVKEGTYRFSVGDKEVSLAFHGGSLSEFAEAVNKKGGKLLRAAVVKNTADSQVLVLEALLTGSKNKLALHDAALTLAEETGMLRRVPTASLDVNLTKPEVKKTEPGADRFQVENGSLIVQPQTSLSLPIKPPFALNQNMVLEYEVKSSLLPENQVTRPDEPPPPLIPETGGIDYKGIHIDSEKSIIILPDEEIPKPPVRVDNPAVLTYTSQGQRLPLPPVADTADYVAVRVPIGEKSASVEAITIDNTNTHRVISLRNVRILDPTVRGEYAPTNPLSESRDAIVEYNGVDVIRDANAITDLIPEVTVNLLDKSDKKIKLSIKYDTEAMKESIIGFVGTYNRFITEIDILTRGDESIIDKAGYMSDAEKQKSYERLAVMKGDTTLMRTKSNMQNIMMNAYKTSGGQEMALLAQIGVATSAVNAGIDKTMLRGYLQIDEGKLDIALTARPELVKELFGYDQDRDLLIDTGVAFTLDSFIKPYTQTGGLVATRLSTIDTQATRKEREITNFKKVLEDKERQLKLKYGKMEGAIENLQKSNESLRNLNSQGR